MFNMKSEKIYLIVWGVIVLIFAGVFIYYLVSIDGNVPDEDWLSDNCDCIERNKFKCQAGFELNVEARQCVRENATTNVLLGCSKYNCTGEVYEVK